MIFIILPLTGLLLLIWLISRNSIFGWFLAIIWGGIIGLILLSYSLRPFFTKITLEKDDYYGDYVINRSYFAGKQADWQYNHFRFTITENDSIFFYVTDHEKVLTTYKGSVLNPMPYGSARLAIKMDEPSHHIMSDHPTVYRGVWSFYLVFNSPKFNNMFFKKGEWQPIKD